MMTLLTPNLGDLAVQVVAYSLVSGILVWRAAAWAEVRGGSALLAPIGAIVFMCSDAFIGVNKFILPFAGQKTAIMLTYWTAQLLLVLSIVCQTYDSSREVGSIRLIGKRIH